MRDTHRADSVLSIAARRVSVFFAGRISLAVLIAACVALGSCSGSDGEATGSDTAVPNAGATSDVNIRGQWRGTVAETRRAGCAGLDLQDSRFDIAVGQNGQAATVSTSNLCRLGGVETGQTTVDGFRT